MGCVLDEVRDVKEYEAGFEVSPTGGGWSLLEGLRTNSQSFYHLELFLGKFAHEKNRPHCITSMEN